MKKLFLLLMLPALAQAQARNLFTDVQLHRDFHREIITGTVEFLEIDRLGTTFFFTDFDFGSHGQQGSYFEIARNHTVLRTRPGVFNLSLQYNDGLLPGDAQSGKGIPRTLLAGIAVSDIKWGTAAFELQALLRQEFAVDPGWQLTGVWVWPLPRTPVEFLGYVDWNSNRTGNQPVSVQAEPQLQIRQGMWAIGTELEISRNFTGAYTDSQGLSYDTWYAHPTVFLRVDF